MKFIRRFFCNHENCLSENVINNKAHRSEIYCGDCGKVILKERIWKKIKQAYRIGEYKS
jgi:hypothetical protein